jgi:hypothetical protein
MTGPLSTGHTALSSSGRKLPRCSRLSGQEPSLGSLGHQACDAAQFVVGCQIASLDRTNLGGQARSPQRAAGSPAPEEAPALAMPAERGFGPDQEEMASPVLVDIATIAAENPIRSKGPNTGVRGPD